MSTAELSRVDAAINHAVEEISKSDLVIAQIAEEYLAIKVAGPNDDAAFESAKTALSRVVRLRTNVEKTRKALKADSLRYGRAVDAEAKRVQALIEPIESHLKTQADIVRLEKARLKVEAENKRREQIEAWARKLSEAGAVVDLAQLQGMDEEQFDWHFRAEKSKADRVREEQRIEREKLEAERQKAIAEREAMEAERAEMRRQSEEQQKRIDELEKKARAEREAKERKEREEAEAARLEALKPEFAKIEGLISRLSGTAADYTKEVDRPAWRGKVLEHLVELEVILQGMVSEPSE